MARDRCRLHGVDAEFLRVNGAATEQLPALDQFDFLIFFACLERMTYAERLTAMRATWSGLKAGALWCWIEC